MSVYPDPLWAQTLTYYDQESVAGTVQLSMLFLHPSSTAVFVAVVIGNVAVSYSVSSSVGWRAVVTHDSRP